MTWEQKFKCEVCNIWSAERTTYNANGVIGTVCPTCLKNPHVADLLTIYKSKDVKYQQLTINDLFERKLQQRKRRTRR